ncbi:CBS domain-containing protein [Roseomonas sp. CCTCC AB2023176]|uniref:CBS domain-containing protein n=1 Tax=Roseomonas sp. CCTCC AB2023176 TaxID=3342640 RepID=UPI0035DCEDA3
MTIARILHTKGAEVVSVPPDASGREIAEVLARHRIGAVLVRDGEGRVVGIVSERDLVRCMARNGEAPDHTPAQGLMTQVLSTVTRATTIGEALALMTDRRVRHLPVMEGGALLGMISIGDLVKARIEEAEHEAQTLREYVTAA